MILEVIKALLVFLVLLRILFFFILTDTKSNVCLLGKTAIVTGGNRGIGYQITLALASRGCRVIIACRSKGDDAKRNVEKYTGNPNVLVKHLDLSSFASVRKFVAEVVESEERLDILVNNAGITGPNDVTDDGLNRVPQVNHYGPFLLTYLLVDLLKKSAPSRVVYVSSVLAYVHNPFLKSLNESKKLGFVYNDSKVYTVATNKIMAKKLQNFGVTVNAAEPGVVATSIFDGIDTNRPNKLIMTSLVFFTFFFMIRSVRKGAQCPIHVAISRKLGNVTGKFFSNCSVFPAPFLANDVTFCKRAWEESVRLSGVQPNEQFPE